MRDEFYMKKVINLAKKGAGFVNPNPLVGAIIVKDDRIISTGYHKKFGEFHAERIAINECREDLTNSTIYVNLEPCTHHGKTPPCCDLIIEKKIKRVVIGCVDPNPLVSGKSIEIFKKHNIEVRVNVLQKECELLNEIFFFYILNNKPFITYKYAMTIDGKTTTNQKNEWISNELSRKNVHKDRNKYSSILVGINTVLKDDPLLNCRIKNLRDPIRIIVDTDLRIPEKSKIVQSSNTIYTIIATASNNQSKIAMLEKYNCHILNVKKKDNYLDLVDLVVKIGNKNIDSIFIEGGPTIASSFLNERLINKIQTYIGLKVYSSKIDNSSFKNNNLIFKENPINIINQKIKTFKGDIFIEGEVEYPCLQE